VIVEVAQANASTAADPCQQPESGTRSDSAGQSMNQAKPSKPKRPPPLKVY